MQTHSLTKLHVHKVHSKCLGNKLPDRPNLCNFRAREAHVILYINYNWLALRAIKCSCFASKKTVAHKCHWLNLISNKVFVLISLNRSNLEYFFYSDVSVFKCFFNIIKCCATHLLQQPFIQLFNNQPINLLVAYNIPISNELYDFSNS